MLKTCLWISVEAFNSSFGEKNCRATSFLVFSGSIIHKKHSACVFVGFVSSSCHLITVDFYLNGGHKLCKQTFSLFQDAFTSLSEMQDWTLQKVIHLHCCQTVQHLCQMTDDDLVKFIFMWLSFFFLSGWKMNFSLGTKEGDLFEFRLRKECGHMCPRPASKVVWGPVEIWH